MTVYDMAKAYYPRLWSAKRIKALVVTGKLTQQQANEIINAKKE